MTQRLSIAIRGAVQGVGFRPFVYRLAIDLSLTGWVLNSPEGVFIEAEGSRDALDQLLLRLEKEKPPRSFIQSLESSYLDPVGYPTFQIRQSMTDGTRSTLVLPDIATCPDCLLEIFDPNNRRYLYPFTNCTNCGPRFSIIESLPYDRPNTTMKDFAMCPACREEYENPLDRRFHAQPNACSACGPHVDLWDMNGRTLYTHHDAILRTVDTIRQGKIVAVKGLGGFHLMVDARNDDAVRRLRERKHREEKPFALMYPSLDMVRHDCVVSSVEERLLCSPESPIVLLKRTSDIAHRTSGPTSSIAPNNPYLGVMLPYTPLHHILMRDLAFPVVATSGNLSDEPICTDERDALRRLNGIADSFLVHNRPIRRHVDDSIVRTMMGREMVVRRARGFAPLPVHLAHGTDRPILAVGAHLKNTIALSSARNVFISQHIGDLETEEAYGAFQNIITSFEALYATKPNTIACDLHSGYLSTQFARSKNPDAIGIQHHYAHVASCMAENQIDGRVLGVSWDGTGYGLDGTVWGGEFLLTDETSFQRVATFRRFALPGGERAIKEPRRTALGVLYELLGDGTFQQDDFLPAQACTDEERHAFQQMLERKINAPLTSSVGRLFDAVASIIGLRHRVSFEGQAAMELEFLITGAPVDASYPFNLQDSDGSNRPLIVVDWSPILLRIIDDLRHSVYRQTIAAKFHNTLADIIVAIARRIGEECVVLTGGCFQNKYLTERTILELQREGFHPYWHQRVPPNDGGIALGQIAAAIKILQHQRNG